MKRRLIAIIVCLLAILSLSGCESMQEEDVINENDKIFAEAYNLPLDEFITDCEEISPDTLLRESETRFGEKIKIKGKIFAVTENEQESDYLIYTKLKDYVYFSEYMDGIVMVGYERGDNPKLLEDDIVTVYGIIIEDQTYTNNAGNDVTVPCIIARKIELN